MRKAALRLALAGAASLGLIAPGARADDVSPSLSTHQMVEAGHAWIGQAGEEVLRADAGKLAAQGLKID
jgi:uncharacterized low-complexity protein